MPSEREELARLLYEVCPPGSHYIGEAPPWDDLEASWRELFRFRADRLLPYIRERVDAATNDLKEQVARTHDLIGAAVQAERERWVRVEEGLPEIQRFISGQGWVPRDKPYVLVADAKGRMSIAYGMETNSADYPVNWTMAKVIGKVTHWRPLPAAPAAIRSGEKPTE